MTLSCHNDVTIVQVDVVVVGGGSAGSTAAIYAQQALPRARVLLLEKANIKRSGAIAIGMDGLNNAVIPGHATPEQYVKDYVNDRASRSVHRLTERAFHERCAAHATSMATPWRRERWTRFVNSM